jgi:hypothetical protein
MASSSGRCSRFERTFTTSFGYNAGRRLRRRPALAYAPSRHDSSTIGGMPQLDFWKDVAIILAGFVGLITFFTGTLEYVRQGHQQRASRFVEMRRRFLETPLFREILNLLPADDVALRDIPIQDRRNFGGFLEEVALMVNSKLISPRVAHYMFGDYVSLAAKSENFWYGLDRDGVYWTVFRQFARSLDDQRAMEPAEPDALRF